MALLKHLDLIPYYFFVNISLTKHSINEINIGLLKCIFKWLVVGNKLPLLLWFHFHWNERDPLYSLHVTGLHFFDYPVFSMLSEWIGVIWTYTLLSVEIGFCQSVAKFCSVYIRDQNCSWHPWWGVFCACPWKDRIFISYCHLSKVSLLPGDFHKSKKPTRYHAITL